MKCHRLLRIAFVFLIACAAPSLALAQDDGAPTLAPFTHASLGIQGVAPQWSKVQEGVYARDDVTAIIFGGVQGWSTEMVLDGLRTALSLDALPEAAGSLETEGFTWSLFSARLNVTTSGVEAEASIAVAETDIMAYYVLLRATRDEHSALHESVFLPALEAFTARRLDWGQEAIPQASAEPVQFLKPEILSVRPHDPQAFTQGFILYDGLIYESTGQMGESTVREVDPQTGDVRRQVALADEYFGEGLERVDDRLIQLTWQAGTAFVYDLETFEQVDTFTYEGEGWGLCYDGAYLYRSDGSPILTLHDPATFEAVAWGRVTLEGAPVNMLNELECVGDYIYANVWQTDVIVQIDKTTGQVVAVVDATGLLTPEEAGKANVLNGIAYDPEADTFLITGKDWPKVFEARFVARGPG